LQVVVARYHLLYSGEVVAEDLGPVPFVEEVVLWSVRLRVASEMVPQQAAPVEAEVALVVVVVVVVDSGFDQDPCWQWLFEPRSWLALVAVDIESESQ